MNSNAEIRWDFTDAVARDRKARLLSWRTFEDIIAEISACSIAPLYWEPAIAPRLKGCNRASFELTVEADVYDGFFNSPVGYRGQFARSESHGEQANRMLLVALFPRLLEAAVGHPIATCKLVEVSLNGRQAKAWIDESEVEDQLSDPAPHIMFLQWQFNDPDGPGLRAPRGTRTCVKGAWVSATGHEIGNAVKDARSGHINRTGDSR